MKALSVKQPFAWAIVNGWKDIENRNWSTHFRGTIAVHACATKMAQPPWPRSIARPTDAELAVSAIVGVVDIVDVVEASRSPWFLGPFGWVLENAIALPTPVPCKGNLKLWDLPDDVLRAVQQQTGAFEEQRPRYFSYLWTGAEFRHHQENSPNEPLRHAASDRFLARGLRPGHVLYLWSFLQGRLMLLGRLEVASIVSRAEAVRTLGARGLAELRDHAIGRGRPRKRFDCEVTPAVIRRLRFVAAEEEAAAKFDREGKPDPQTFRGIRQLTDSTARLLDELLAT